MSGRLFEPVMIRNLQLRNRLVMPAMVSTLGDSKSRAPTQQQIDYYVERAKNDLGLVIVEATSVMRTGRVLPSQLSICDDSFIAGLSKLAEAIKQAGAKCFLQIHHAGRRAPSPFNEGAQPVAPSAIPLWEGEMPRELALEEIEELIEAYGQAARRAKEAGFDGVEVHGGHGYLPMQFLSPLTNKRRDEYGGDLISRARFGIEVVRSIVQRAGENYPLSYRISADEFIKGGVGLKEVQIVAKMLEEAGVYVLDISAGYYVSSEEGYHNTQAFSLAPMSIPRGRLVHLAEEIKKVVRIPVMAVGRLDDPYLAEEIVALEKVDLVAIGRGLLADSTLAAKFHRRQYTDVRRCLACNTCRTSLGLVNAFRTAGDTPILERAHLRCAINAELGKEMEYRIRPTSEAKRVLVIGGGPGGMETARVAALRGHKVTLMERKPHLGGNLVAASAVPFKRNINCAAEYLSNAVCKLGVEIRLDTEADESKVLAFKPDVVILATGALPLMPSIAGIERDNVTDAIKALEGRAEIGSKVVVVGAGMIGCEVAAFLAESGKEVTIVSRRETDFSSTGGLAPDMESATRRWFLSELWPTLGIKTIGKSTFQKVTEEGLIVEDREGRKSLIGGDNIVFALGMKPDNHLRKKLEGKVPEFYEAGDCVKPRQIVDAISEAARVARLI